MVNIKAQLPTPTENAAWLRVRPVLRSPFEAMQSQLPTINYTSETPNRGLLGAAFGRHHKGGRAAPFVGKEESLLLARGDVN